MAYRLHLNDIRLARVKWTLMQIVLEQIEHEKRDASDLVVSFSNDSSSTQEIEI